MNAEYARLLLKTHDRGVIDANEFRELTGTTPEQFRLRMTVEQSLKQRTPVLALK